MSTTPPPGIHPVEIGRLDIERHVLGRLDDAERAALVERAARDPELAARIETGTVLFDAFVEHLRDAIAIAEQKGPTSQVVRNLNLDDAKVEIETTYELANGGTSSRTR